MIAKGGAPANNKAGGDNPAIVLITIVGANPPTHVTINEMTTVASVWTHNQLIDGTAIKGQPLQLKIAAGNVPSLVDLATGGWGGTIQDPLNSGQTTTMANFATLADALAGCVARAVPTACDQLYAAAAGPEEASALADTLTAAESIAKYPWYQPQRVHALLATFYPIQSGKTMRPVPYMPYLSVAPSAWVLPLKFDGGGYRAGGKAMFDSQGNLWVGDNFTVGWQAQDALWQGNATKFDPNGKPLSPITTGFSGGGMQGGTFGMAVDAHDNGRLGLMQGIIATPGGDIWALGINKSQLLFFPGGDYTKGRIVCEGRDVEPCTSFTGPFHLAIDQQNRIWVSNAIAGHVTRFPATDPTKVAKFSSGWSGSGLNIDSQGNVWVTNRLGNSDRAALVVADLAAKALLGGNPDPTLTRAMSRQTSSDGGSVTLLRPDGSQYPGSPFKAGGLPGPWAVVVDGNDNVWISNFASPNSPIAHLCGVRTENCPPGSKTGDQISPPGGYMTGALQMQTDLAISPVGDVWVMNNWQDINSCFSGAAEAPLNPVWWPGRGDLLRHGQTGTVAPNRACETVLATRPTHRVLSQLIRRSGDGYDDVCPRVISAE